MKIQVNYDRCDGHGVCAAACPDVFSVDEDLDLVRLLIDEPPTEMRQMVETAVRSCPKGALKLS